MKVVLISDTHGRHFQLTNLPAGDVIIHAGDISTNGKLFEIINFLHWFSSLNYKYKILVAGNHDKYLENINKNEFHTFFKKKIIFLKDTGITIEGIKFWGTPYQPEHNNWAFNKKRGKDLCYHWNLIPDDIDIVITHTPSFGILDKTNSNINVGCQDLGAKLSEVKPRYHVFGHIHEHWGSLKDIKSGIVHINASLMDKNKILSRKPLTINIKTGLSPKSLKSSLLSRHLG